MTAITSSSVSVIIPVFNGANYLGAALESIRAQTAPVAEIIVVDDGSTDGSAEIAAAHSGIKVIRQANQGTATALNQGIARATSEYLAFLDADDLWSADKSALQFAALRIPNPPDLVLGHAQNFHSPDLTAQLRQTIHCPPAPLAGYVVGTLLARRETFARIGPFDPQWRIGSHIEWFARAQDLDLTFQLLPEVVLYRRLHAHNLSRDANALRLEFAQIMKLVLDRRRAQKTSRPSSRHAPAP
ncbi:MAG: glycosyltransferase [Opitutaceae bacterium]|nr:glycosyltransferase [Opitutaceae bacterium]MBP9912283.1 glycosyltransferase [Opitutaceae bacterium]